MQAWMTVYVVERRQEATDIVSLALATPEGTPLPPFDAGSHIDVEAADGIVRQYSLCNDPRERDRYLIAVLRDPATRGGSAAIHDAFRTGKIVRISEPRNHFALVDTRGRSLLIAGGIGITPLLAMAETLARAGSDFMLHYCARSADRMAFRDRIAASPFADRVAFHFDDGDPAQAFDAAAVLLAPARDDHLYVCGPAGFIQMVLDGAAVAGWPETQVHREFFSAPVDEGRRDAFEVQLASSGRVLAVPADRSIADVLLDAGVDLPLSCESGVCGTCVTRVLDGVPDHRDVYLTDAEHAAGDQMTPCCSRALSARLVLDL